MKKIYGRKLSRCGAGFVAGEMYAAISRNQTKKKEEHKKICCGSGTGSGSASLGEENFYEKKFSICGSGSAARGVYANITCIQIPSKKHFFICVAVPDPDPQQ
jgi:hypothetical protein